MNIYDQLQAVEDRYEELGELLSDPDVVSDTKRFMELSKEEASTRDTVTTYREYKQVLQNIVDAEEMIKESGGDADLEEMAKQELKDAKAEKEELFAEIEEELFNNYRVLPLLFYNNTIAVNDTEDENILDGNGNIDFSAIK